MEKGESRRPPAKPQFAAGVPASPQWKHDFTLTGERVADRYAAVGYLEIAVFRNGDRQDGKRDRKGRLLKDGHTERMVIPKTVATAGTLQDFCFSKTVR